MLKKSNLMLACLLTLAMIPFGGDASPVNTLTPIPAAGERFISLKDVADYYGFSMRVPPGRDIYLQNKPLSLRFEVDSRQCWYNGTLVWLHAPVLKLRGRWVVTEADVRKVIDPLLRTSGYLALRGYHVVVLDPGHGGLDRGARGRHGVEEKRVVLDIAKRARVHLANAGLKVYLTRETDRFIELGDRADQFNGDVFVSIHLNSSTDPDPKGLETYVLASSGYPPTAAPPGPPKSGLIHPGNRFDGANTILGYCLQKALLDKAKGEDRGIRRARFEVLREAQCPAALVECGFLSNSAEEQLMLSDKHREDIALAIAKGILDYIASVKNARGVAP